MKLSAELVVVDAQVLTKKGGLPVNGLKPGDEVALMAFGLWPTVLQDFTKDRQLVAAQVAAIESMGPWIREGTHIDEAVYEAARRLGTASNPNSRRIIAR